ncbi:MAG: alpha/beta hydrolase-fold protein [Bacteroidetes bacterium]|nr:alpha/beta hydrolase-fold protein [Bacteroidota bacterium]
MRLSSFLLTLIAIVPYLLQAQEASLLQSVSPIRSDSTCAINCEDPGYRLMTQVIDGETITREYIIHVPSGYQEGDNLPLVIVYHGFGGCAYYMADETGGLNDLADEENFFVAYPQAAYRPAKEDTYWEPGFNGGESIYLDDIFFSEQLIEHIDEEFSLDLSRLYAAGYSNGGMLTYSLACLRGDLFEGVCIMSGALLDEMDSCDPTQPVPMIIFHGTGDFVLPYNGDQYYASVPDVVSLWVDHFQIPTSTLSSTELNGGNVVHDSYYGGTNNTCLSLYTVIEEYGMPGDHVWFGQDMDGVSPNRIIWDFFSGVCGGVDAISYETHDRVQASPVPFGDQLFLGNIGVSSATYHMYDVRGVVVRTGRLGSDGLVHGLGDLPAGCYLLRVGESIFQVVK